ncbi:MAG: FHA domain-containing protein [Propionibacteriaceae bacterium]|nr:FHA domain-containing protein [Propionibacteriaceae bacterium]
MGVFDSVEKKLENAVGGVFARAFRGDVQPVEITARLQRELDSEAKLLSRDRKLVPNEFHIAFSTHDFGRLSPYSSTLNAEVTAELHNYAAERGYIFNGPVTIEYAENAKLPIGRFKVTSAAVAGVEVVDEPLFAKPGALAIEVNGYRHPLNDAVLVIGRGTEADLRINDPGISRQHARILVQGHGAQATVTIEDLGSTNGISVDGQKVKSAPLHLGSQITIGNTSATIVSTGK